MFLLKYEALFNKRPERRKNNEAINQAKEQP